MIDWLISMAYYAIYMTSICAHPTWLDSWGLQGRGPPRKLRVWTLGPPVQRPPRCQSWGHKAVMDRTGGPWQIVLQMVSVSSVHAFFFCSFVHVFGGSPGSYIVISICFTLPHFNPLLSTLWSVCSAFVQMNLNVIGTHPTPTSTPPQTSVYRWVKLVCADESNLSSQMNSWPQFSMPGAGEWGIRYCCAIRGHAGLESLKELDSQVCATSLGRE